MTFTDVDSNRKYVSHEAVPQWARVPFIVRGYRKVGTSFGDCVKSAFMIHNETVNFWSHFLPFVLLLFYTPYVLFVLAKEAAVFDKGLIFAYLMAGANCLASSSCFHLFGCHGHKSFRVLGRTDFKGIILMICASYMPALNAFFKSMQFWRVFYLSMSVVVMIKGIILVEVFARRDWTVAKDAMFVFDAAWGLIPIVHFVCKSDFPREVIYFALQKIATMYGIYLLGFILYISRVPERFIPGKLDHFGHSHQLWHGCVNLALINWLHSNLQFLELVV